MTTSKLKPKQGTDGRFLPGNSGNGGRQRGSRNKLSEAFLDALCGDFDKHGVEVIEKVRQSEPAAYLRVVASLMPKRIEAERLDLASLSDEELEAIARGTPETPMLPSGAGGRRAH